MERKTKKSGDWRKTTMSRIRTLIKQADPHAVKKVKWKIPSNPAGVPVWYHDGMICTGETFKQHLRISFARGPHLKDPKGLINTYRAIVIREGDKLNETAFKNLIREAVAFNVKHAAAKKSKVKKPTKK